MSFLSKLFGRKQALAPVESFTQAQIEAMIDALAFAMIADGEHTSEEWDALRAAIPTAQWSGEGSLESAISHAIERAEQHTDSQEDARAYCRDIGARLADDAAREAVYALAARVVCSDHTIARSEQGLMTIMIQEFPVDRERAMEISSEVHAEYSLL